MDTSRDDVGIAIRSAFLRKGAQQRFSLFALVILSVFLLFLDSIEAKPLNYIRSFVKDTIYRGAVIISYPAKSFKNILKITSEHINLYKNYNQVTKENEILKGRISEQDYLKLENTQLRELIDDQVASSDYLISSRVIIDKQSPYLNSFIINSGSNKKIKNGLAVLDGENFVGRIVDVNFFSSRVLLVSDLNSKIPVIIEPSGNQAILSGRGKDYPILEYLPPNNTINENDKIYTSGKEGIFDPGIPIGVIKIVEEGEIVAELFSDLSQITFINIKLED